MQTTVTSDAKDGAWRAYHGVLSLFSSCDCSLCFYLSSDFLHGGGVRAPLYTINWDGLDWMGLFSSLTTPFLFSTRTQHSNRGLFLFLYICENSRWGVEGTWTKEYCGQVEHIQIRRRDRGWRNNIALLALFAQKSATFASLILR